MGFGERTFLTSLSSLLLTFCWGSYQPTRRAAPGLCGTVWREGLRGKGMIFGICGEMLGLSCSLPRIDRNSMLGLGASLSL